MTAGEDRQPAQLPVSLRLKLTLWMTLISVALQLTLALVMLVYERQTVGDFFNRRLEQRESSMAQAIRAADFQVTDEDMARLAKLGLQFVLFERFIVTLYDDRGEAVASNTRPALSAAEMDLESAAATASPVIIRRDVPALHEADLENPKSRVLLHRLRGRNGARYTLLVATTDTYFETVTTLSQRIALAGLLIGMVASAVGAWVVAGLATAPLVELARLAGSLNPDTIEDDTPLPRSTGEIGLVQKELLEVRAKLRAAIQARDRFVSNVSHELKTPIAVLLTEAQTLRLEGLTPEGRQFVHSTTEEMRRLSRMVSSFLMLAKLQGGKEPADVQSHNVNEIVMEAVSSCHKMAGQYQVTLAPQLDEGEAVLRVSGNADLLRVMLDNLIHNAIRFSPSHELVFVRITDFETEVEVAVRDFGPGIPEEAIEAIFDRFVQASEAVGRERGYGLGLSIAQGIAELHAGRITVRNMPDRGCEFTVRLPLVPEARAPARLADGAVGDEAKHPGAGRRGGAAG